MTESNRTYIAIDLKSFYASVECKERGFDPMNTNLVVADERESRIAIDRTGAGRLAGDGDMIFTKDENDPGVRLQAAFASDEEIDRVAAFLRNEVSVE